MIKSNKKLPKILKSLALGLLLSVGLTIIAGSLPAYAQTEGLQAEATWPQAGGQQYYNKENCYSTGHEGPDNFAENPKAVVKFDNISLTRAFFLGNGSLTNLPLVSSSTKKSVYTAVNTEDNQFTVIGMNLTAPDTPLISNITYDGNVKYGPIMVNDLTIKSDEDDPFYVFTDNKIYRFHQSIWFIFPFIVKDLEQEVIYNGETLKILAEPVIVDNKIYLSTTNGILVYNTTNQSFSMFYASSKGSSPILHYQNKFYVIDQAGTLHCLTEDANGQAQVLWTKSGIGTLRDKKFDSQYPSTQPIAIDNNGQYMYVFTEVESNFFTKKIDLKQQGKVINIWSGWGGDDEPYAQHFIIDKANHVYANEYANEYVGLKEGNIWKLEGNQWVPILQKGSYPNGRGNALVDDNKNIFFIEDLPNPTENGNFIQSLVKINPTTNPEKIQETPLQYKTYVHNDMDGEGTKGIIVTPPSIIVGPNKTIYLATFYRENGMGDYHPVILAFGQKITPPGTPQTESLYTQGNYTLTWDTAGAPDTGIEGYEIIENIGTTVSTLTASAPTLERTNLSEGERRYKVRAKDPAGNWSEYSDYGPYITVDKTNPNQPAINQVSGTHVKADANGVDQDYWINGHSATFSWDAVTDHVNEGIPPSGIKDYAIRFFKTVMMELPLGSGNYVPITIEREDLAVYNITGTIKTVSFPEDMPNGKISAYVYAYDKAGNYSYSAPIVLNFDYSSPNAPSITNPAENYKHTDDNPFTVTWNTSTDPYGEIDYYEVNTSLGLATIEADSSLEYSLSFSEDGACLVTITAYDKAGNSAFDNRIIVYDSHTPNNPTDLAASGEGVEETPPNNFNVPGTFNLEWLFEDAQETTEPDTGTFKEYRVMYRKSDWPHFQLLKTISSKDETSTSVTLEQPGNYTIHIEVEDKAGHVATSDPIVIHAAFATAVSLSANPPDAKEGDWYNNLVLIKFTNPFADLIKYQINPDMPNPAIISKDEMDADGSYTVPYPNPANMESYSDGEKTILYKARDENGDWEVSNTTWLEKTFKIDRSAPQGDITLQGEGPYVYDQPVVVEVNAQDPESDIQNVIVTVNNTPQYAIHQEGTTIWTKTVNMPLNGKVSATIRNGAGKVANINKTFSVDDTGITLDSAPNSWPKYRRDLGNTGYAKSLGPTEASAVKAFNVAAGNYTPHLTVSDGFLYIGFGNNIVKPDLGGTVLYAYPLSGNIKNSPAITGDGDLYIVNRHPSQNTYQIAAIDKNLTTLLWDKTESIPAAGADDPFEISPAIGDDGTIYYFAGNQIHKVNPDTHQITSYAGPEDNPIINLHSSPAITEDLIFFGLDGTTAQGQLIKGLARIKTNFTDYTVFNLDNEGVTAAPAIGREEELAQRTVYAVTQHRLYAVFADSQDGSIKWRSKNLLGNIIGSPVIGPNKEDGSYNIYVLTDSKKLYIFNSNPGAGAPYEVQGVNKELAESPVTEAVLSSNGVLYYAGVDNLIHAYDIETATDLWTHGDLHTINTPPILVKDPADPNGKKSFVFYANNYGQFFKITDNTGPASPTNLKVEGAYQNEEGTFLTNNNTVSVSWDPVTDPGDSITYTVWQVTGANNTLTPTPYDNLESPGFQHTFSNVNFGNFRYQVQAKDIFGNVSPTGAQAETLYFTIDKLAPAAVASLETKNINKTSITLQWEAVADTPPSQSGIKQYVIKYAQEPVTEENWDNLENSQVIEAPAQTGVLETTVEDLDSNTSYYFAVKAQDNAGNWSAISNILSVTTNYNYIKNITVTYTNNTHPEYDFTEVNTTGKLTVEVYDGNDKVIENINIDWNIQEGAEYGLLYADDPANGGEGADTLTNIPKDQPVYFKAGTQADQTVGIRARIGAKKSPVTEILLVPTDPVNIKITPTGDSFPVESVQEFFAQLEDQYGNTIDVAAPYYNEQYDTLPVVTWKWSDYLPDDQNFSLADASYQDGADNNNVEFDTAEITLLPQAKETYLYAKFTQAGKITLGYIPLTLVHGDLAVFRLSPTADHLDLNGYVDINLTLANDKPDGSGNNIAPAEFEWDDFDWLITNEAGVEVNNSVVEITDDPTGQSLARFNSKTTSGTYYVTATHKATGLVCDNMPVYLVDPDGAVASFSVAPLEVEAGEQVELAISAQDQYGNPINFDDGGYTFIWSLKGPLPSVADASSKIEPVPSSGTTKAIFDPGTQSGEYELTVKHGSLPKVVETLTVLPKQLKAITLEAVSDEIEITGNTKLNLTGMDEYGNPVSVDPNDLNWSVYKQVPNGDSEPITGNDYAYVTIANGQITFVANADGYLEKKYGTYNIYANNNIDGQLVADAVEVEVKIGKINEFTPVIEKDAIAAPYNEHTIAAWDGGQMAGASFASLGAQIKDAYQNTYNAGTLSQSIADQVKEWKIDPAIPEAHLQDLVGGPIAAYQGVLPGAGLLKRFYASKAGTYTITVDFKDNQLEDQVYTVIVTAAAPDKMEIIRVEPETSNVIDLHETAVNGTPDSINLESILKDAYGQETGPGTLVAHSWHQKLPGSDNFVKLDNDLSLEYVLDDVDSPLMEYQHNAPAIPHPEWALAKQPGIHTFKVNSTQNIPGAGIKNFTAELTIEVIAGSWQDGNYATTLNPAAQSADQPVTKATVAINGETGIWMTKFVDAYGNEVAGPTYNELVSYFNLSVTKEGSADDYSYLLVEPTEPETEGEYTKQVVFNANNESGIYYINGGTDPEDIHAVFTITVDPDALASFDITADPGEPTVDSPITLSATNPKDGSGNPIEAPSGTFHWYLVKGPSGADLNQSLGETNPITINRPPLAQYESFIAGNYTIKAEYVEETATGALNVPIEKTIVLKPGALDTFSLGAVSPVVAKEGAETEIKLAAATDSHGNNKLAELNAANDFNWSITDINDVPINNANEVKLEDNNAGSRKLVLGPEAQIGTYKVKVAYKNKVDGIPVDQTVEIAVVNGALASFDLALSPQGETIDLHDYEQVSNVPVKLLNITNAKDINGYAVSNDDLQNYNFKWELLGSPEKAEIIPDENNPAQCTFSSNAEAGSHTIKVTNPDGNVSEAVTIEVIAGAVDPNTITITPADYAVNLAEVAADYQIAFTLEGDDAFGNTAVINPNRVNWEVYQAININPESGKITWNGSPIYEEPSINPLLYGTTETGSYRVYKIKAQLYDDQGIHIVKKLSTKFLVNPAELVSLTLTAPDVTSLNTNAEIGAHSAKDQYGNPVDQPGFEDFTFTVTREGDSANYNNKLSAGTISEGLLAVFNPGDLAGTYYIKIEKEGVEIENAEFIIEVDPEALADYDITTEPAEPTVEDNLTITLTNFKDGLGNPLTAEDFKEQGIFSGSFQYLLIEGPNGTLPPQPVQGNFEVENFTVEIPQPAAAYEFDSGNYTFKITYNGSAPKEIQVNFGAEEPHSITLAANPATIDINGGSRNIIIDSIKDVHGNDASAALSEADFIWEIIGPDGQPVNDKDVADISASYGTYGRKFVLYSTTAGTYTIRASYKEDLSILDNIEIIANPDSLATLWAFIGTDPDSPPVPPQAPQEEVSIEAGNSVVIWLGDLEDQYNNPVTGPTLEEFVNLYGITVTREGTSDTYNDLLTAKDTPNDNQYRVATLGPLTTAGTYYLTGHSLNEPENITSFKIIVTPASPTNDGISLEASKNPVSIDDDPITLTLVAHDPFGNPLPAPQDGSIAVAWEGPVTPAEGDITSASFDPADQTLGIHEIKATITVPDDPEVSFTPSIEVEVLAGAPAILTLNAQKDSVEVNKETRLYYSIADKNNNPLAAPNFSEISWSVEKEGVEVENTDSYVKDYQAGEAKFEANDEIALFTVKAQYADLPEQSVAITVTPGELASFDIGAANAVVSADTEQAFGIENAVDSYGNPVDTGLYTFVWPAKTVSPVNGATLDLFTNTTANGSEVILNALPAGKYTKDNNNKTLAVKAYRDEELLKSKTFSFDVTPSEVHFEQSVVENAAPGSTVYLKLVRPDNFDSLIGNTYSIEWDPGEGSLPVNPNLDKIAYTVGTEAKTYTLTFKATSAEEVLEASVEIAVIPGPVAELEINLDKSEIEISEALTISLVPGSAKDQYNNIISDLAVIKKQIKFEVTPANNAPEIVESGENILGSTEAFNQPGTYTITAKTDAGSILDQKEVVVNQATLAELILETDKENLAFGEKTDLSLSAVNSNGAAIALTKDDVSWSVLVNGEDQGASLIGEASLADGFASLDPGTIAGTLILSVSYNNKTSNSVQINVESNQIAEIQLEASANEVDVDSKVELNVKAINAEGSDLSSKLVAENVSWKIYKGAQEINPKYFSDLFSDQFIGKSAKFDPTKEANLGAYKIKVTYGDLSDEVDINLVAGAIKSIQIEAAENSIEEEDTTTLTLKAYDSRDNDVTDKIVAEQLSWSITTDNANDAAINKNEKTITEATFIPTKAATYKVMATYNNGLPYTDNKDYNSNQVAITVTELALDSLSLTAPAKTLKIEETLQINSAATSTSGKEMKNLTAADLNWEVSNPDLGSIDENGLFTAGTTTGICTVSASNGEISASIALEIKAGPVSGEVEVKAEGLNNLKNIIIEKGDTIKLSATGHDAHGNLNTEPEILWNKTSTASNFEYTAASLGEQTIKLEHAGGSQEVKVMVIPKIEQISVSAAKTSLSTAATTEISATILDEEGQEVDLGEYGIELDWKLSGGAEIQSAGTLKALETEGSYTLAAGFNTSLREIISEPITIQVTSGGPKFTLKLDGEVVADPSARRIVNSNVKITVDLADGNGVVTDSVKIYLDGAEMAESLFSISETGQASTAFSLAFSEGLNLSAGTHTLKIVAKDLAGQESTLEISELVVYAQTGITGRIANYPNPFRPASGIGTKFSYSLTTAADIKIMVYDITGKKIWETFVLADSTGSGTLASPGSGGKAGYNEVPWNGISAFNQYVGNGVYIYFIVSDNKVIGKGQLAVAD